LAALVALRTGYPGCHHLLREHYGREGALISIPLWAVYVASLIGYVVIQRKRYKP